jgi:pyroglutamyl-peptidase
MDTYDIHTEILPVVYEDAINRIQDLIQEIIPDILLSFGVAASRYRVNLERVVLNLKDASIPDNAGFHPKGELINPNAQLAYFSNLPLQKLRSYLEKQAYQSLFLIMRGHILAIRFFTPLPT